MAKATSRKSSLIELGDLKAEPGSKSWAIAIRDEMRSALDKAMFDSHMFEEFQRLFRAHRGWEKLADNKGNRFLSYEAFCLAEPPHGLGYDLDAIDRIVAERKSAEALAAKAEPLAKHGGDRKSEEAEGNQGSDRTLKRGETAEYLTARIARDAPEVLERMKQGEFKSVRAAAKAAGIVKEATAIEKAKKAFLKLSEGERREFLDWGSNMI